MAVFDWCARDKHKECIRSYQVFVTDLKTNKPVFTGEVRECECRKRGCPCYIKPADRVKKKKTRRKT